MSLQLESLNHLVKKHASNCYKHVIFVSLMEKDVEDTMQINIQRSMFHLKFRWFGAPLFLSGAVLLGMVIMTWPMTHDHFSLLLGFGCAMSGLTVFGVNHNTAMAFAVETYPKIQQLPQVLRLEVEEDLKWDKPKTLGLKAHPKTSLFIPFLSIFLQGYVFTRLSCRLQWQDFEVCSSTFF